MTNGIIRACFGLYFPETNSLWKGQREAVPYFRSLCYSLTVYYLGTSTYSHESLISRHSF